MKFILVRHGETAENTAGVLMGHMDMPLNAYGIKQADQVALRLQKEKIDAFFCSDLDRCVSTLASIRKFHPDVPLMLASNLRERHFGDFSGKKRTEVDWDSLPGPFLERKPAGGESLNDLLSRLEQVVTEIRMKYADHTVVLVAHSGPIKLIRAIFLGIPFEAAFKEPAIANASVSEIVVSEQGSALIRWNDASHLEGGDSGSL